ncbi:MAG: AMP-binding protein [Alphaproteobacteria bacterium]
MSNRDGYRFKADPIRRHARDHGDSVAVIFQGRETTYRQLDQRCDQVANGLVAAGIQRGQRIAILAKNTDLFYELLYGATKVGAVLAPINFRLAPPEVSYVINDAQAQLLFVGEGYDDLIAGLSAELSSVAQTICLHDGSYEAWRDGHSDADPMAEVSEHDTIIQVYSSGTTGHPKGVEISHDNFIQYLPNAMDEWGAWDAGDVCLVTNPLLHAAGCVWSYTAFYVGGTNVLMPEVDPALILKTIERYRVTQALLVPAVILFMLQTPGVEETDVSSVKMIMYGASPIPLPVLERAVAIFDCGFGQLYGLTETTGAVTYLAPGDRDGSDKMKSVGKVMEGAKIRAVDEHDRDCRSAPLVKSSSGARPSPRAIGTWMTKRPRRSGTAGSIPAMPVISMRRAIFISMTGSRT